MRIFAERRPSQWFLFLFVFVLTLSLASCGGSSNSSTSGNTPTGSTPTPGSTNPGNSGGNGSSGGATLSAPKFVYALDSSGILPPGIDEFRIDPSTGVLTNIGFINLPSNNSLSGMAATPATAFVFVGDWIAKTITTLKADPSSGALTKLNTMSIPQIQGELQVLTDPAGKFLFVSDTGALGPSLLVFAIGSSGSLTPVPGSPFGISTPVTTMTIDAAGKFLFGNAGNQILGFNIASNGALTMTSDSPTTVRPPIDNPDKGPVNVATAIDPAAHFLFASDTTNPVVYVYAVATDGKLTLVNGSPFPSGVAGFAPVVDPRSKFLFLGSFGEARVASLTINQSTGAVTPAPGSPYDNGPFRNGGTPIVQAVVDPSGKFVLFDDSEETKITVFSIDQSTGALTNVPGSPFLAAPQIIGGGSPSAIAVTH